MRKLYLIFCFALALLGCNSTSEKGEPSGKLKVVATTGMIADLIKNVALDSVEIEALMGPGVDPHLYKATQGDLGKLQQADVIFYNGLHLEGKMSEVFEKLGRIKTVKAVADAVDQERLLADPTYQNTHDPHIWFDVELWSTTLQVVEQALKEKDPENADFYHRNAEKYKQELIDLHVEVQGKIAEIPEDQRILITAHDAFSYFGRSYGIEVRGLQGLSTASEFGLKDRVDLINFIVEKGIKAVFVETSVSEKNIEAIVEGCGQKGHEVRIGGSLYSDAMGEEGTAAGTYAGMVRANVKTITEALK